MLSSILSFFKGKFDNYIYIKVILINIIQTIFSAQKSPLTIKMIHVDQLLCTSFFFNQVHQMHIWVYPMGVIQLAA